MPTSNQKHNCINQVKKFIAETVQQIFTSQNADGSGNNNNCERQYTRICRGCSNTKYMSRRRYLTHSFTVLIFIPLQFTTSLTAILISSLHHQRKRLSSIYENKKQSYEIQYNKLSRFITIAEYLRRSS